MIKMSELAAEARTITLTASLSPEEGGYVARCLELPVVTEGDTIEDAVAMLREAVELYLEDEPLPARPSHPRFFTEFDVTVPAA
jgi:predicted RNase H-like HicB family nuclease